MTFQLSTRFLFFFRSKTSILFSKSRPAFSWYCWKCIFVHFFCRSRFLASHLCSIRFSTHLGSLEQDKITLDECSSIYELFLRINQFHKISKSIGIRHKLLLHLIWKYIKSSKKGSFSATRSMTARSPIDVRSTLLSTLKCLKLLSKFMDELASLH